MWLMCMCCVWDERNKCCQGSLIAVYLSKPFAPFCEESMNVRSECNVKRHYYFLSLNVLPFQNNTNLILRSNVISFRWLLRFLFECIVWEIFMNGFLKPDCIQYTVLRWEVTLMTDIVNDLFFFFVQFRRTLWPCFVSIHGDVMTILKVHNAINWVTLSRL